MLVLLSSMDLPRIKEKEVLISESIIQERKVFVLFFLGNDLRIIRERVLFFFLGGPMWDLFRLFVQPIVTLQAPDRALH